MTRAAARQVAFPAAARQARCLEGDRIWAYLDGELPAPGARAVARHVGTCAICGPRALRLRAMLASCRTAGCRKLPADVRARARTRVQALLATGRKKS